MMLRIPAVLAADQIVRIRQALQNAEWGDGNATSGSLSANAKQNEQLPESSRIAREIGNLIQDSLAGNPLFFSAALPFKVFPPLFNRYSGGNHFGTHVDNAIRQLKGSDFRIRTDLSATLFLADPASYDGGELVVEDTYGTHQVKLEAGDMILYPASSLHQVLPVTRGTRLAAFFWIQSMIRDDGARRVLFDLDQAIQDLNQNLQSNANATIKLTGVYHNLLRKWSEI